MQPFTEVIVSNVCLSVWVFAWHERMTMYRNSSNKTENENDVVIHDVTLA